jgi:hypothetical protein
MLNRLVAYLFATRRYKLGTNMYGMLTNRTPFAAKILPTSDERGEAQRVVVVKGTFDFDGTVLPTERQIPVFSIDQRFAGVDSAVRFESDDAPRKAFLDVIVNAVAHAPAGKAVEAFNAGLRIGSAVRSIRIFGPRLWRRRAGVLVNLETHGLVTRLPVSYEWAFGGVDPKNPDRFFPMNPIGLGFGESPPSAGLPLPQIENSETLIRSISDRPDVAGFGVVEKWWQPRIALYGRSPIEQSNLAGLPQAMPPDFDVRAWNAAPRSMQFPANHLDTSREIALVNLTARSETSFEIPPVDVRIDVLCGGEVVQYNPRVDTVILEPEFNHFVLIWRLAVPVGPKLPPLEEVGVSI